MRTMKLELQVHLPATMKVRHSIYLKLADEPSREEEPFWVTDRPRRDNGYLGEGALLTFDRFVGEWPNYRIGAGTETAEFSSIEILELLAAGILEDLDE